MTKDNSDACKRRSARVNVMLVAELELPDRSQPVKLRNLSDEGALVEGAGWIDENTEILFKRNDLQMRGRVVWVKGRYAGISFGETLDHHEILRNVSVTAPRPVSQEQFRRPGVKQLKMSAYERRWFDYWTLSATKDRSEG